MRWGGSQPSGKSRSPRGPPSDSNRPCPATAAAPRPGVSASSGGRARERAQVPQRERSALNRPGARRLDGDQAPGRRFRATRFCETTPLARTVGQQAASPIAQPRKIPASPSARPVGHADRQRAVRWRSERARPPRDDPPHRGGRPHEAFPSRHPASPSDIRPGRAAHYTRGHDARAARSRRPARWVKEQEARQTRGAEALLRRGGGRRKDLCHA